MKTQVYRSLDEFLAREDKTVNGVSEAYSIQWPNFIEDNETNTGCWNCNDCVGCVECNDCYDCTDCTECFDCHQLWKQDGLYNEMGELC